MYRLLIFDLDGTLIDSLDDLAEAVNRVVFERGGRTLSPDEVARMVGDGATVLLERAVAASGARAQVEELLPGFLEVYDSLLPGRTRPYAGVPEMLATAGGHARLAVLTNKPAGATRRILDLLDLSRHFAWVVGGDGPFRRKPSPDGLVHLMTEAGAEAAETLLVGDSTVDLQAARAAGSGICVARYGFGQATFDVDRLRGDERFADNPLQVLDCLADPLR